MKSQRVCIQGVLLESHISSVAAHTRASQRLCFINVDASSSVCCCLGSQMGLTSAASRSVIVGMDGIVERLLRKSCYFGGFNISQISCAITGVDKYVLTSE